MPVTALTLCNENAAWHGMEHKKGSSKWLSEASSIKKPSQHRKDVNVCEEHCVLSINNHMAMAVRESTVLASSCSSKTDKFSSHNISSKTDKFSSHNFFVRQAVLASCTFTFLHQSPSAIPSCSKKPSRLFGGSFAAHHSVLPKHGFDSIS